MTDNEIQELTQLLKKCEPGLLPLDIFLQLARLTVLSAIEFIPLRPGENGLEVLLLPRPDNDPIWAGQLHTPGTILRPDDTSFEQAFGRLFKDELGYEGDCEMAFIGFNYGHGERGATVTFEYIVRLPKEPKQGVYYPIDDLPENFIPEQKPILDRAVAKFNELAR